MLSWNTTDFTYYLSCIIVKKTLIFCHTLSIHYPSHAQFNYFRKLVFGKEFAIFLFLFAMREKRDNTIIGI